MRSLIPPCRLAAIVGLALFAAGCAQPTPSPVPATPTVVAAGPALTVERAVVKYRALETDELEEVPVGSPAEVAPGGNVVVDEAGKASLSWPKFLTNTLLANVDTLLSLSEPASRHVILDQAAGTARYTVEGAGEPTDLQVNAGFLGVGKSVAVVELSIGPADFLVSVEAGEPTVAWVAMVDGSATVTRGEDALTLTKGMAAAFTQDGELPTPQPLDATALADWYTQAAAGTAEGGLAVVALRCTLDADTPLRGQPAATGAATATLPKGTVVAVLGRTTDGAFVSVRGAGASGWAAAEALSCSGPLTAAVILAGPTATPTARRTLPPRVTATVTPTARGTGTATPTPTGTVAAYTFNFGVSPGTIEAGDCATLSWDVTGVQAVYLDGGGVAGGTGQTKKVCPDETTTYTMEVVKPDGTKESKSVTVKVVPKATVPIAATDTPLPEPTDTPLPEPTDTPEPAPTDTAEPAPSDTPAARR